jgi:Alr-MurF fusion protein
MKYTIQKIKEIMGAEAVIIADEAQPINHLLLDSRKVLFPKESLFFALPGSRLDGHTYLDDAYSKGIRNFVVSKNIDFTDYKKANIIWVENTVKALQKLAIYHRKQFHLPTIGITGSNGKTIVKEWLHQMLHEDFNIVRSPKSYNSQIGVPLSVWQIEEENNLAIFEAGISEAGEMEKLEKMIQPTIGIFTSIGEAHNEGFLNIQHKIKEKLRLFIHSEIIIYCKDYPDLNQAVAQVTSQLRGTDEDTKKFKSFTWSRGTEADVKITKYEQHDLFTHIDMQVQDQCLHFKIPFTDKASVENSIHCIMTMLYLKTDVNKIQERLLELSSITMRLELKNGINGCSVINDSYNSDLNSFKIAVDFLVQHSKNKRKTVVLSDILQSGKSEIDLYSEMASVLEQKKINRVIAIGPALLRQRKRFEIIDKIDIVFYANTQDFLNEAETNSFKEEDILLKGARPFKFERISRLLEEKAHDTVLEINLNAILNNLKTFQRFLKPEIKMMVMVKAFAYGAGAFEIANLLQFNKVDYLGVAYTDEGVELRKAGITMPIMVMNPDKSSFENLISNDLEPEIYSLNQLNAFIKTVRNMSLELKPDLYPVHIELDTGMHRLGFQQEELKDLIALIKSSELIKVESVFSHLAASEDPTHNEFTQYQVKQFEEMSQFILSQLKYPILRHIVNSAGIIRHPYAHFDMVRLGLGVYGVDGSSTIQNDIQHVGVLKTTISQIKKIKKGNTIGYGRVGIADHDKTIATVSIGYADGFDRRFSNGVGHMLVNGKPAPVIGNVCMDMTMLDITGIDAKEGDSVVVFSKDLPIYEIAQKINKISYELLTGISPRVKRIYFEE